MRGGSYALLCYQRQSNLRPQGIQLHKYRSTPNGAQIHTQLDLLTIQLASVGQLALSFVCLPQIQQVRQVSQ